ncbi:MAG: TonB-dependent receptor [Steroidobacteraceae bacterium]|jgi:outer membrane receptor protein involved in Fe transport
MTDHLANSDIEATRDCQAVRPQRWPARLATLGVAAFGLLVALAYPGIGATQSAETAAAPSDDEAIETIMVTARKRSESVADVPEAISVFSAESLQDFNIQNFSDYATKVPNVSFTYGGGPTGFADARSVAIRGITGQNLTGTAGATGFYIDDTPVPGSVDPRVLDIDNIEILKGPQGTLYGESSLGGNVKLVTKQPDLNENGYGYMAEAGLTSGGGSMDGGGNFIGNLVLVPDHMALRIVLFANHDAGYLTRTYPNPSDPNAVAAETNPNQAVSRISVGDQGADGSGGGSLALRWDVTSAFTATMRVMFQDTSYHGFDATYAPLPSFTPVYTLNRAFNVQPEASDDWALPSLDLKYAGTGWSIVSSSSFFYRHTSDIEDSTYGTDQVFNYYYGVPQGTIPPQPYLWDGEHYHNQATEELRFSFDPIDNWSGTFGGYYSHTHTRFTIPPTYANGLAAEDLWPTNLIWQQTNPGLQKDSSLFGEVYYKFLDKFNLTLGARQYWLAQESGYTANGFLNDGYQPNVPQSNSESGFSPKVSLSYQATDAAMIYASASKGFRAGGAQSVLSFCSQPGLPANDIAHLQSDTLWTYELGTKIQPQPGLLITADVYHIVWDNLQQQVALACGFYFDVNGNQAQVNGAEIEATGRIARGLELRLTGGWEHTDINDPGPLGAVGIAQGSQILGVPTWNASVGLVYTQPLTSTLKGIISADYSYTGDSLSLLNGGTGAEVTRPAFSLVNLRFGVERGDYEMSLNVHNLLDAKPNLGDLGYVGYAQFVANSSGAAIVGPSGYPTTVIPQVATMQPLTVMLQFQKRL